MNNIHAVVLIVVMFNSMSSFTWALEPWTFEKTYETKKISPNGFGLFSIGDINGNGTKEVIVTDFNPSWEINPTLNGFNLYIIEWQKNGLNVAYHKQWDRSRKRFTPNTGIHPDMRMVNPESEKQKTNQLEYDRFAAYSANQLITWNINRKVVVETMPPYFAIEWEKGKYVLHDEQVWEGPGLENTIGSWALPWISPSCYSGFARTKGQTRECLVGIRDFSGHGHPKIVSVLVDEIIVDKKYRETLRIRDYSNNFPIEWKMDSPNLFGWWAQGSQDLVDRLKLQDADGLLITGYEPISWYVLKLNQEKKSYELINTKNDKPMDIKSFSLPDVYLGKTQSARKQEYWGYRVGLASDKGEIWLLRKVDLANDYSFVKTANIDFKHHEPFLGVVYFKVADIDGDGIDEIILVERTGKRQFGEDQTLFSKTSEYVRILKWNGHSYQSQWISPPYNKIGTTFMVDDIKNTGKKQLVILTPYGSVQIWERR